MTEIERKALALVNGCFLEVNIENMSAIAEAYRSLHERHEVFKQEVSDAVREVTQLRRKLHTLARFIIPDKPDPLVDVLIGAFGSGYGEPEAGHLRAALSIHGLEIVEKK